MGSVMQSKSEGEVGTRKISNFSEEGSAVLLEGFADTETRERDNLKFLFHTTWEYMWFRDEGGKKVVFLKSLS